MAMLREKRFCIEVRQASKLKPFWAAVRAEKNDKRGGETKACVKSGAATGATSWDWAGL